MEEFLSSFIIFVLLLPCVINSYVLQTCSEPNVMPGMSFEDHLNITVYQSFSIIPNWYETIATENEVPLEYIDVHHRHFFGNVKCKNTKRNRKNIQENTLNNLSQCMWRYVENIDINRKPRAFLEVECICKSPLHARKNAGLICERVFEYVLVYRRIGCFNGVYKYKRVWEPRAVACVATRMPEHTRLKTIAYKMSE